MFLSQLLRRNRRQITSLRNYVTASRASGRTPFRANWRGVSTVGPLSTTPSAFPCWPMACWAAVALIGGTGIAVAEPEEGPTEEKGFHLLGIEQRRRAFFKYEKRIRDLSSPEKIFEYFSTRGSSHDGFQMTPSDIMRSVVPVYPPSGSDIIRAGSLPGEPSPRVPQHESTFFSAFDVDQSGGVSFDEWLLFEALLSIPEDDVDVAFALMDDDGSGKVDKKEFGKILEAIQTQALRPTTTHHKSPVQIATADGGLVSLFFGADGKQQLSPAMFKQFVTEMRDEMTRLEYEWYNYKGTGSISARDFALSIVGCARLKHVDGYLDKVHEMPATLANKKISFEEFKAFRAVWARLKRLSVALEFWRSSSGLPFSPKEFQSLVKRVMQIDLSDSVVDVIFYLFDHPEGLNTHFMLSVMDRSYMTGPTLVDGAKKAGNEKSFFDCMSECTKKRG